APESLHDRMDHRADIYSLGVSLYVALGGPAPHTCEVDIRALTERRQDIDGELRTIIACATAKNPNQRFGSAAELERALSLHLSHRYPQFTLSSLSELVRRYAVSLGGRAGDEGKTLVSVTRSDVPTALTQKATPIALSAGVSPEVDRGVTRTA